MPANKRTRIKRHENKAQPEIKIWVMNSPSIVICIHNKGTMPNGGGKVREINSRAATPIKKHRRPDEPSVSAFRHHFSSVLWRVLQIAPCLEQARGWNEESFRWNDESKEKKWKQWKIKLFLLFCFYYSHCWCTSEKTKWRWERGAEHRRTVSRSSRRWIFPFVIRWRLPWCRQVWYTSRLVIKFEFLWSFFDQNAIKIFFVLTKMTIKVELGREKPAPRARRLEYILNGISDELFMAY